MVYLLLLLLIINIANEHFILKHARSSVDLTVVVITCICLTVVVLFCLSVFSGSGRGFLIRARGSSMTGVEYTGLGIS